MAGHLLAFLAVSAVVICTPGPDTALTIRNTLFGGRPAGIATAAGVAAGQASWTLCTAAALVATLGGVLRRVRIRRALDLASGAVLVGLGLRLAGESS
ncbi:MAG: hypothetical protein ACRENL_06260 [Candidatus Dormibacteria bacterium]